MTEKTEKAKNLNEGHRQRMRDRYFASGLDGFCDHEILELMLFYAVPRSNTNPIAHELMNRFSTLAGVLDAEVEDLVQIHGISKKSALFLKMFPEIFRRYEMSKSQERWQLTDARSFAKHLKTLYIGAVQEIAYIFCLDTKLRVICREVIGRGVVDSVAIQERAVAEIVLRNRSSRVVLVHNHMDGSSVPSSADIYMTKQLYRMFRTMHITLEDHFIVGDRVVSMKQEGYWDEDF